VFNILKPTLAPLVLRLGLAFIFVFHGYVKITVGKGDEWNPDLEDWVQLTVAWGELAAGLALLVGLLTRVAALGIILDQIGAIALVTGRNFLQLENIKPGTHGFNFRSAGFEYNFAIIVICLALVILGSGAMSLDHLIFHRRKE
jgi:putative oxidoreductase